MPPEAQPASTTAIAATNRTFFISLSPLVSFGQISRDRRERQNHLIVYQYFRLLVAELI
nr:MAG TPA: hypothetical protein [Bacteriophage sp.]